MLVLASLLVVCSLMFSAAAQAETVAPGWEVVSSNYLTHLQPGGTGVVVLDVYNVGSASSSGMVTMTDALPQGVRATEAYPLEGLGGSAEQGWSCPVDTGSVVRCTTSEPLPPGGLRPAINLDSHRPTHEVNRLAIVVAVEPDAVTGVNRVSVAGGGALLAASSSSPIVVGPSSPGFRFAGFDGWASNADGTPDTQAGSHPYELTISFHLNEYLGKPGDVRNIGVNAPPGLVGDPTAVPQCSRQVFDEEECPASTQVGTDIAGIRPEVEIRDETPTAILIPVYNLIPPKGVPAQFGFTLEGIHTFLDAGVRTGGDNGITEHVDNVEDGDPVGANSITLWGTPAEASHDDERCAGDGDPNCASNLGASSDAEPKPFLTLPTSCGEPPRWTIEANSWQEPANVAKDEFKMHDEEDVPAGLTGCEKLVHFTPASRAPRTRASPIRRRGWASK